MNTRLHPFAAAALFAASVTLTPAAFAAGSAATPSTSASASAAVRICTFPGSPSNALDRAVALEAFKTAGIAAKISTHGFDASDDDGVSAHELSSALGRSCDVIAGFPRSSIADASGSAMRFSHGYLRAGYVSIALPDARVATADKETVAATYATPSQLIAVQEQNVRFDLENTPALTVDAVVAGRAQRAVVWYPAVVAYGRAHPGRRFRVSATVSPYADWQLVFAFAHKSAALQKRVDAALARMKADGRLDALTRGWAIPEGGAALSPADYRDKARVSASPFTHAALHVIPGAAAGRFIKVSSGAGEIPAFDAKQVEHGKALYSSNCAKCHGAKLEGITAPALSGPAFAPVSNSHLTVGGIFGYMSTNMPADRPGKLKDQEYADLMAFLLSQNGYAPSAAKLTADGARGSATPLNAGPVH